VVHLLLCSSDFLFNNIFKGQAEHHPKEKPENLISKGYIPITVDDKNAEFCHLILGSSASFGTFCSKCK